MAGTGQPPPPGAADAGHRPDDPRALFVGLMLAVAAALVWSGVAPRDRFVWFLEVAPVLAGMPALVLLYPRFRFTPLAYVLMALHATILIVGGHYTYAEMPLFDWLRDALELSRNHYDRVGHFAQGFVPAIVVRELLLRRSPLGRGAWLFVLTASVCLAFSALYELVEWVVAETTQPDRAEAFLATQGDVFDTQKDMALALLGAVTALATLGRLHDRQLARAGYGRTA